MSRFIPAMTRVVVGLGQETEDGKELPVILRQRVMPFSGSGTPPPQVGLSKTVTGSPYAENNPLPL